MLLWFMYFISMDWYTHQILDEARMHWLIGEFISELNDQKSPNKEFVICIGKHEYI